MVVCQVAIEAPEAIWKEPKQEESVFVKDAKRKLEEYFQTSVHIGTHNISIHYENEEDLNRILELLNLVEE